MKDRVVDHHFFCEVCRIFVKSSSTTGFCCPHCDSRGASEVAFFSTLNIREQIEILLSGESLAKYLYDSLKRNEENESVVMSDLTDGSLHKEQRKNSAWSDLTLTINVDGANVFTSSKSSLWPIHCVLNELPVALRWTNILLAGLWFGGHHPAIMPFLQQFVTEVQEMGEITWKCQGKVIRSKVQVLCCCVDTPARAAVLNAKQFNGYFGCNLCLHESVRDAGEFRYSFLIGLHA